MVLLGVALVIAFIPVIGPWIAHLVDRVRNGHNANKELKARAEWYRFQVAKQLGIDPSKVTKQDFVAAAQINPHLASAVREVERQKGDANRLSLMATTGASVASAVIPGGGTITRIAVGMGGAVGGGALSSLMTKESVDAQQVAEAINEQIMLAQQQGMDPRRAVPPQLVFMLRVSQDEALADAVKKQYGKAFHKMSEAEQSAVMQSYPSLANASVSEAYAVGSGMLPVQELVAASPNLNGMAASVAAPRNASFAARLEAERRARAQQTANIPSI